MSDKQQKSKSNPGSALLAGATAGGVEGAITYPFEFLKTKAQFASSQGEKPPGLVNMAKDTYTKHGIKGFYSGCAALVTGNAAKAAVRFLSYDKCKSALVNEEGKLTPVRSLLAGLGAGMMEAVFAVTPSETIKTKLIDDSKSPNPRFRGMIHGTPIIIKEEGIGGIYRGLFPVMMRQGANSAVRFSSYSYIKSLVIPEGKPATGASTFIVGGLAGIITVYCTMPLDVIKTRMQSLEARTNYRNSFHCAYRIFTEEGILRFWKGTTPRLGRLIFSGGIVFYVYENLIVLLGGRAV